MAGPLKITCRVERRDHLQVETSRDRTMPAEFSDMLDLTLRVGGEESAVYLTAQDAMELSNWLFAWAHGGNRK